MSNKTKLSFKQVQIDKTNTVVVATIAVASACLVFSIIATKALWGQASYNKKVITAKESTVRQLEANIASINDLNKSYRAFVAEPTNIIGGSSTGTGDRDGDNAKITLDSLPSVYDFPGTISGINKILITTGVVDININGTDQEVENAAKENTAITSIPLTISAGGNLESTQSLLTALDQSIRPMNVNSIEYSTDSNGELTVTVKLDTWYQPKKKFEVKTEVVR